MPRALSTVSIMSYSVNRKPLRTKKGYSSSVFSMRKKNRVFFLSVFFLIILISTFLFNLSLNVKLVEANFRLKEVEEKLTKIDTESQSLDSQIIQALSIDKIRGAAGKLKLVKAENIKFVKIPKIGSLSLER